MSGRPKARPLHYGLAVLLVLAAAAAALALFARETAAPQAGMRAGAFDPPHAAPAFALRGSDGSEVTLARYRGKVVLLTFGFTHCAAVCPTTLATLAQARNGLGTAADGVQVVFVTVDPERDSAAHMQRYLAAFDRSFIGATGAPEELAAVREAYGVTAEKQGSGPDYAMAHTSSIFLIDPAGRLRGVMPFGRDADDFVHDVGLLL
ncbi:MAG TPA: SCO family protein [Croceibacterium sp.]|nr:SCO family protein [Croceibacterium sp.]